VTKVFIKRPMPYVPTKPGEKAPNDIKYELPAGEYCTLHGASSSVTTAGGIGLQNPPIPGSEPVNTDTLESSTQDEEGTLTGSAIEFHKNWWNR
jgi:hypothetical protein